MDNFEEKVIGHLTDLKVDTAVVKTKVESLEAQTGEQFDLIRNTSERVIVNEQDIKHLKNHRNGKGWLGRMLVRAFIGGV